jgi:hypothetical protein
MRHVMRHKITDDDIWVKIANDVVTLEGTGEEWLHYLNAVTEDEKRKVLSSKNPKNALETLIDEMKGNEERRFRPSS